MCSSFLYEKGIKMKTHEFFMKEAVKQAKKALKIEEVPIGCIIVKDGKIISRAYNKREQNQSSTAHAEILAIQKANKKLNSWRLDECDIYVTLEPCLMCTGAISLSRFRNVIYGAKQHKVQDYFFNEGLNHYPNIIGGILEEECSKIIKDFFSERRENK